MSQVRNIIIEGVDRLGKDTLIDGLLNRLGFFQVVHYKKPTIVEKYLNEAMIVMARTNPDDPEVTRYAQKTFQVASFGQMFNMLGSHGHYILNRAHLGEVVYAKRYRGYPGDYVFDLEKRVPEVARSTLTVLLHTSDFSFIQDDGLSHNFDKKEEEQNDFIRAFERSELTYKLMLDVCDGAGAFVPADRLLTTVVKAYEQIQSMPHPIWNVSWSKSEDGTLEQINHLQPDPKASMNM